MVSRRNIEIEFKPEPYREAKITYHRRCFTVEQKEKAYSYLYKLGFPTILLSVITLVVGILLIGFNKNVYQENYTTLRVFP